MGAMTYAEYLHKEMERVNKVPLFWAFSQKQLDEALAERNAMPADVYQLDGMNGCFCLKKDFSEVKAFFNHDNGLEKMMQAYDFRVEAFYYEMCNHEYGINYYQRNWDVLNCFSRKELVFSNADNETDYLQQMGHEDWLDSYIEARRKYFRAAEEGEWF